MCASHNRAVKSAPPVTIARSVRADGHAVDRTLMLHHFAESGAGMRIPEPGGSVCRFP